ncbi:hypothetical protein QFZ42_003330 [Variovorax paradoxus]|uniref:hypothetical protein n=1 Tax=Variovorax paradoxus TaxID=34073 RepID=UPI002790DE61|nr:hypothetical protein [Variovorax paradoxus]MDQ0571496.1 hypothetical protein [Variovorax paradoxus]
MNIIRSDDYWPEPSLLGMSGAAHAVSNDPTHEDEAIRLLHEAVKEVTGKAVEPAPKARIGFLP